MGESWSFCRTTAILAQPQLGSEEKQRFSGRFGEWRFSSVMDIDIGMESWKDSSSWTNCALALTNISSGQVSDHAIKDITHDSY